MRNVIFVFLMATQLQLFGQNLSNNIWVMGSAGYVWASFNGANMAIINVKGANIPRYFVGGSSNICDSATGKFLFSTNGMVIYDSLGNVMQNGDTLVPINYYTQNAYPMSFTTQSSLILPMGNSSSGKYYVFTGAVSDTTYTTYWLNGWGYKTPYDMLQYHIVDLNINGGLGKVIIKKKTLLSNTDLARTGMQACRHANGEDWWLLKQGLNTNTIYKFLVRKDTIMGPYIQTFGIPTYGWYDFTGQSAFSDDGKKYAFSTGATSKLFIADFDRCSGELSNPKQFNIPIDSTTDPFYDNNSSFDSVATGICFSKNGNFVYISKWYNIYQLEYGVSDSNLAWYRVKHGADTTLISFAQYATLYRGVDDRMYIGKLDGQTKQMSTINNPNGKGSSCGFCRKCFRKDGDTLNWAITAPPSMPNFSLGKDPNYCTPISTHDVTYSNDPLEVFPNPVSTLLFIRNKKGKTKELYNSLGQRIYSTTKDEIDISRYNKGIYYLKCEGVTGKVVID